ncbi:carbohydrate esterase family 5 protein [Viridothelium virens]|uniref:Carbohydrate esterase family 5 protein n=1 Tax=Viridothelium virens TaxID=1048519 RepID=A0A6A6HJC9_VIRVR|nr:carbohydrate esterase family 5 protein [Viridothelium virens]
MARTIWQLITATVTLVAIVDAAITPDIHRVQRARKRQAELCSPLELVIARGTDEPGNPTYGIIVGDPLFNATSFLIPAVTGYAVNYPANLDCDSRSLGSTDILNHLATQTSTCPSQKFVLVGYSQGADVVHLAISQLDPSYYPAIDAIVVFGDPGNRGPGQFDPLGSAEPAFPAALANRIKENCAFNDPVCTNNGTDVSAHLSYDNAGTPFINGSARYIESQFQSGGDSGPDFADDAAPGNQTLSNLSALESLASLLGQTSVTGAPSCPSTSTPGPTATGSFLTTTTPTGSLISASTSPVGSVVSSIASYR